MKQFLVLLKIWFLDKKPFSRPWYQYFELPTGLNNYRYVKERGKLRTELMVNALEKMDFDRKSIILDVGGNAGVFGIYLSKRVGKIYSIELDPKFHKQALFLKSQFEKYIDLSNLVLINTDINLLEKKVIESANTLIISKVIYHNNLNQRQSSLLEKLIHDDVSVLILQGHTTQGELGSLGFMTRIVEQYGFSVIKEVLHDEYPLIIAKRK